MPDCTTVQKLEHKSVIQLDFDLFINFEALLMACIWFEARGKMDDICFSKCHQLVIYV